jgi:hypothetical protein
MLPQSVPVSHAKSAKRLLKNANHNSTLAKRRGTI